MARENENFEPIAKKRKVLKIGSSYYISIPKEWFEIHDIDTEKIRLLLLADKDIRIVNPEHEEEVYRDFTKMVRKVKT